MAGSNHLPHWGQTLIDKVIGVFSPRKCTYHITNRKILNTKCINDNEYFYNKELLRSIVWYLIKFHQETLYNFEINMDGSTSVRGNRYHQEISKKICHNLRNTELTIRFQEQDITIKLQGKSNTNKNGDINSADEIIILSSYISQQHLNNFLTRCRMSYVETEYKQYDNENLYYYDFVAVPKANSSKAIYKRYNLQLTRKFDTIFFDQKEELLQLVDLFNNKKGIYSLNHIPYRLNILLSRVPEEEKHLLLNVYPTN